MIDPLDVCIHNFGPPPRRFGWRDRVTHLRVPKPAWLRASRGDKLNTLYDHLDELWRDGVVVWGHVVQANQLMFEEGRANCPGEVLFSTADHDRVDPDELGRIAHDLFALKGTKPTDPDLSPIADYLTDEMVRVFGLPVPRSVSGPLPCRISTTMFVRKHLPGRRLCGPLLPVVVHPRRPHVALPLPAQFWPVELAAWWAGG